MHYKQDLKEWFSEMSTEDLEKEYEDYLNDEEECQLEYLANCAWPEDDIPF